MTRIANLAQHVLIQNTIESTQARVFSRQAQVASGKEAQTFDGLPREAERLVNFEAQFARAEEFIRQNDLIQARIQITDSSIDGIFQVASELKVRLLQRVDASTGTAGGLAAEATNMLDTVAGLMNTQINGRFLFAGSATQTQPVIVPVPDPAAIGVPDASYYQGDSVALQSRASESTDVTYGIPGDRRGFQEIIGALKAAIQGDTLDDKALLDTAIGLVDSAVTELNAMRASLGAAANVVARATATHENLRLYAEGVIGEIENVDVPEAIAALTADETALQASFMTVGRLARLTLVDFLR